MRLMMYFFFSYVSIGYGAFQNVEDMQKNPCISLQWHLPVLCSLSYVLPLGWQHGKRTESDMSTEEDLELKPNMWPTEMCMQSELGYDA